MKNEDQWQPTKFVVRGERLMGSRNTDHVNVASRLIGDRIAACYETTLREHVGGDLLDLGCGRAPLYAAYRPYAGSVTCVDWPGSPHDVQHADLLCDINEKLPVADESFDTIICSDVLEHLHHPKLVMSEIRRVLRPGGKLFLNVPFMYGLHEQPYDYHRYTRFALEQMAAENGLQVIELREIGGAGDVACNLFAKLIVRMPMLGNPIATVMQTVWSGLRRIGPINKAEWKTAPMFPLGYFTIMNRP